MKELLEKLLPATFIKSPVIKNGWERNDYGIIRSVSMEESNFHPEGKKWFLAISLDFKSDYCFDADFYNHICEASVSNGKICSRENMRIVDHWNEADASDVTNIMYQVVLPWIDRLGNPLYCIDFLLAAKVIGQDEYDQKYIELFGGGITSLMYHPPRLRKLYDEYLAALYESVGENEKAINHLEAYKIFYEKDNAADSGTRKDVLKKIEDSLVRLKQLI